MNKPKKQIPATHFKKYYGGGRATSATGRSAQNTQADPAESTSDGSIDYMNDKRTKGLSTNQYIAGATALSSGIGNMTSVYNNPNATSRDKDEALSSTVTGTIGAINPAVGSIIGVGDAIGKPIRSSLEQTDPNTGKLTNRSGAKIGAVIGSFLSPSKMIGMAAEGNWDITGNKYADNLEKEALDRINAQKAEQAAYDQQLQAQQAQQAQYNLMFQDYQNRNKQYAQGGMNMIPNAEVEKQENSVAPNGQFTQFNGPSHANGGIKTNLEPGEMIFSDRLKLGKKTFAQLNKSNNTNKEDKILEDSKSSNISTRTAALMKMAKLKSSEELFNIQEQLKQDKVIKYAQKMGVSLPQMLPSNDQLQQYPFGGGVTDINPGMQQFIAQRYNPKMVASDAKSYKPQGRDLSYVDKKGQLSLEGSRFTPDSLVNIPNVDPNLKAAYNNGKFVVVGTTPQASLQAQEFNKGVFKRGKDGTVYTDYSGYLPQKAYGGLQKFDGGGTANINNLTPREQQEYQKWFNQGSQNDENFNPDNYSLDNYYKIFNPISQDSGSKNTNIENNTNLSEKPSWLSNNKESIKEGFGQVGMGLLQNAGNIYNLSRYNKPEIEKYQKMIASYLDPTAALRDAEQENRRAEVDIRNATSGNSGNYLSNRIALNTKNVLNKDRIRQQYANTNAGISNSINQYNNELARQEVIANAQNRARTRSGKEQAISQIGSNIANQFLDSKKGKMDQDTLELMMKYYDNPEFQKALKESNFNKKSKKTGK